MTEKSRDTRVRVNFLIEAYIQSLVGIFALRLPDVQNVILKTAPVISLSSSYDEECCNLEAYRIVNEIHAFGPELQTAITQVTSAFIGAMWDILKTHAHYQIISTRPEIQFFRHLRNACSHDGKWCFKEDLKHPAAWRDKVLTQEHDGKEIYSSLLKHGDILLLFTDIDLAYFEQREAQC